MARLVAVAALLFGLCLGLAIGALLPLRAAPGAAGVHDAAPALIRQLVELAGRLEVCSADLEAAALASAPGRLVRTDARHADSLKGTDWKSLGTVDRLLHSLAVDHVEMRGPKDALLLRHRLPPSAPLNTSAPDPYAGCDEVDVVTAHSGKGRCLVVEETTSRALGYRVSRWVRGEDQWELIGRLRESTRSADGRLPLEKNRQTGRAFLSALWASLPEIDTKLYPMLRTASDASRRLGLEPHVLVMAVNSGNLDLLLNFVCSLRANAMGEVVDTLVVFAADATAAAALEDGGISTFIHPALGSFGKQAARV